jgi:membrane protein required for colicin V production
MTSVDLAVLGVMALSGLLAYMRGFVREVLSIGAWFGAVALAVAGQSAGRDIVKQWISDPTIASVASFVAILLVSLIVLKIIARSIGSLIKSTGLGAIDRTFGLVFGLARGAAIAIAAYMVAGMTTSSDHWPEAVRNARSLPLVYEGAVWVRENILPNEYRPKLYPPPGGQTPTSDSLLRANPLGRAVLGK